MVSLQIFIHNSVDLIALVQLYTQTCFIQHSQRQSPNQTWNKLDKCTINIFAREHLSWIFSNYTWFEAIQFASPYMQWWYSNSTWLGSWDKHVDYEGVARSMQPIQKISPEWYAFAGLIWNIEPNWERKAERYWSWNREVMLKWNMIRHKGFRTSHWVWWLSCKGLRR